MSAAAAITIGNGTPATISPNAAAASTTPAASWITRPPIRISAAATSAITAAPRPRTIPAMAVTSPYST